MQAVRRHRRAIMFVISLFALGAMTVGYLRRIGMDPLAPSEDVSGQSSSSFDAEGAR